MPDHEPKPKRGRSDEDELDEVYLPNNIVSLLEGLNTKMDKLNATVSENSSAIKDIDARLSTKIDYLESTVTEHIKQVRMERVLANFRATGDSFSQKFVI